MRSLLLSLLLLAPLSARAAGTVFSQWPSTNTVNADDLLLLDSHLGGTNYATRTVTASLLPAANWTASGTTNSTLAGVARVGSQVRIGPATTNDLASPTILNAVGAIGSGYNAVGFVTPVDGSGYSGDELIFGYETSGGNSLPAYTIGVEQHGDNSKDWYVTDSGGVVKLWLDSTGTFRAGGDASADGTAFLTANASGANFTVAPSFNSVPLARRNFADWTNAAGIFNGDTAKFVNGAGALATPGGGSQTPWTGNIDGGGYKLTNVLKVQLAPVSTSQNVSTWSYTTTSNSFNSVSNVFNGSWDDAFSIGNGTASSGKPSLNWTIENYYNTAVGVSQIETYLAFDPGSPFPWTTSGRPWSMDLHLSDPSIDARYQVSTFNINDITGNRQYFKWSTSTNASPVSYYHYFDQSNLLTETVATNGVVSWSASGPAPQIQFLENGSTVFKDDGTYFQVVKQSSGGWDFVVRHSDGIGWFGNPDTSALYTVFGNDGNATGDIRVNKTGGSDSVHIYGSDSSISANWARLKATTATPTGAQIGNGGAIYWVSNAVAYVSVSPDGSSVTTKQVAP